MDSLTLGVSEFDRLNIAVHDGFTVLHREVDGAPPALVGAALPKSVIRM